MVEFPEPITFDGLGLRSAAEFESTNRDPDEASVSIFNPRTAGFEKIAGLNVNFSKRCNTFQFLELKANNFRTLSSTSETIKPAKFSSAKFISTLMRMNDTY